MSLADRFAKVRADFPILRRRFHGKELVYLDSAATTLKPEPVVKRIADYYLLESANVHRGAYALSDEATRNFEEARADVASLIHASPEEIVFVRNTTEAVNLAAHSWAEKNLSPGDHILITELEHHANIVPWQILAEKKGLKVVAARILDNGQVDEADLFAKLKEPVKLLAITGCSNALGTFTDLSKIIPRAHAAGVKVLVDAAQLISQKPVNVRELDVDFLVFSGHKLFGPTGIGVFYARHELLKDMPPWQGGGSMIAEVTLEKTTFNEAPFRFEAGTPHIEGTVGLHAAIRYFQALDFDDVRAWEHALLKKATDGLRGIPGIILYGDVPDKGAILSFNLRGAHHSDVGQILDQQGVAVRAGHHCTQPLMKRLGVPGTVRASFSIYNNDADVEAFLKAVSKARELLT
ncbi:MAG: cysteine desulfurase [Bdellovibrionaceae bacterium]|nr:cysteine desulfurase [Pseudobdellovibrionaceae bacterium]MBX3034089.1 cysteine desulfurase [Pseudobdellovibrionaceae bacterium]